MTADILTIGDEILIGQIINTNSAWIAQQLNLLGIKVNRMISIGDTRDEILNALAESSTRSKFVFITGGLGPTSDDITKPALCEYFNTDLRFDEAVYAQIEEFLKARGGSMNALNREQAMVPVSAKILNNVIGTASGLWFEKDDVIYISMPGVPFEMESLMQNKVLPELKAKFNLPFIYHRTILTIGIPESKLALTIEDWEKQLPSNISLAYLPSPGIVKLRLSAMGDPYLKNLVESEIPKLKKIIGNAMYGFDNDTMELIVGKLLKEKNATLSLAESCTGGNISKLVTSVSGSSEYYKGGVVAYSNEIKTNQLNVPSQLISKHGAVSQEVVESMAINIINIFESDYSIAISGIAGPNGGSKEKPVGTVWIAIGSKEGIKSQKFVFGDNRERNIARASIFALNMLRNELEILE